MPKRKLWVFVAGALGLLFACILIAMLIASSDKPEESATSRVAQVAEPTKVTEAAKVEAVVQPTDTPVPNTPAPSRTSRPTVTPDPTNTPEPTPTPKPTFASVTLAGAGQTATDPIELPAGVYKAHFTHGGNANFIVKSYQATTEDLLINKIGAYDGVRPVVGGETLLLDIDADGAWSLTIDEIGSQASPAFSGRGDAVSDLFEPPASGPWTITHDGQANFIVRCQCAGGASLVQNEIGAVDGSRVVQFSRGPCFWDVKADGSWALQPR